MSILEKVRASGDCPPSLIGVDADADFETAALKVVDANGTSVVRMTRWFVGVVVVVVVVNLCEGYFVQSSDIFFASVAYRIVFIS